MAMAPTWFDRALLLQKGSDKEASYARLNFPLRGRAAIEVSEAFDEVGEVTVGSPSLLLFFFSFFPCSQFLAFVRSSRSIFVASLFSVCVLAVPIEGVV